MARNVEIKAHVLDFDLFYKRAQDLCSGQEPTLLEQFDTFFNSNNGRLKLRQFQGTSKSPAELIFYDRPDSEGPKVCDFIKVNVNDAENLGKALSLANGIRGIVKKKRWLFLFGQTRIHLDSVEELGNFMELEVCLREDQSLEHGQDIVNDLMTKLGVRQEDLIKGAYIDKLVDT